MSEQLYSAEEAAQILGLQVRTVRNYVRQGRLPGVRIGKQYRISRSALEAFAGAGGGGPTASNASAVSAAVTPAEPGPAVEVSSVVEIAPIGPAAASRIERMLAAATLTQRNGAMPMHVEPLYDERRLRLKLILVGSAAETAELLRVIDALSIEDRTATRSV